MRQERQRTVEFLLRVAADGHRSWVRGAVHAHRYARLGGHGLGRDALLRRLVSLGREIGKEGRDRGRLQLRLARLKGAGVEVAADRANCCGGIDAPSALGHRTRVLLDCDGCPVVGPGRVGVASQGEPRGRREVDMG
jgi:hypothetical protein